MAIKTDDVFPANSAQFPGKTEKRFCLGRLPPSFLNRYFLHNPSTQRKRLPRSGKPAGELRLKHHIRTPKPGEKALREAHLLLLRARGNSFIDVFRRLCGPHRPIEIE